MPARTLLFAALLGLAACGGSSDPTTDGGQNADAGNTGACSIVGTFKNTLSSGAQVTMTVTGTAASGNFSLHIATAGGTVDIAGTDSVANGQVTITNTSSSPSSVQGCIGQVAVYGITWTTGCTAFTLAKVSDQCTGRVGDANGATLTRQ